jgi:VCBS repeat-containing protein
VADNDEYATDEDTPLVVAAALGVLLNDSDPNSDPLTAVVVAQPQHGTLVLNADGSFTYTPDEDFHGTDGFSYTATDGTLDSDVAAVTITVNPVNDAPLAADDSFTIDQDTELSVAAPGVLTNDTDVEGIQTVSVNPTPVASPQHGTLTLNSDGSFLYTPDTGYVGPDSFTYEISDGEFTSQATVNITVQEPGEGEAGDAALLAFLDGDDEPASAAGDDWIDAVDEAFADLA